MESRHLHGTCTNINTLSIEEFPSILASSPTLGNPANIWCLLPAPLSWDNAALQLQWHLHDAAAEIGRVGKSFRLSNPKFERTPGTRPTPPNVYPPTWDPRTPAEMTGTHRCRTGTQGYPTTRPRPLLLSHTDLSSCISSTCKGIAMLEGSA